MKSRPLLRRWTHQVPVSMTPSSSLDTPTRLMPTVKTRSGFWSGAERLDVNTQFSESRSPPPMSSPNSPFAHSIESTPAHHLCQSRCGNLTDTPLTGQACIRSKCWAGEVLWWYGAGVCASLTLTGPISSSALVFSTGLQNDFM